MLRTEAVVQTTSRAPKTAAPPAARLVGRLEQRPHRPVELTAVRTLAVDGSQGGREKDSWECEKPQPGVNGLQ